MRTHVILDEALVQAIDDLVGKRKRSRFIEEAVKESLRSKTLLSALQDTAGVLSEGQHPEWATDADVATWVREGRRQSDQRGKRE